MEALTATIFFLVIHRPNLPPLHLEAPLPVSECLAEAKLALNRNYDIAAGARIQAGCITRLLIAWGWSPFGSNSVEILNDISLSRHASCQKRGVDAVRMTSPEGFHAMFSYDRQGFLDELIPLSRSNRIFQEHGDSYRPDTSGYRRHMCAFIRHRAKVYVPGDAAVFQHVYADINDNCSILNHIPPNESRLSGCAAEDVSLTGKAAEILCLAMTYRNGRRFGKQHHRKRFADCETFPNHDRMPPFDRDL